MLKFPVKKQIFIFFKILIYSSSILLVEFLHVANGLITCTMLYSHSGQ